MAYLVKRARGVCKVCGYSLYGLQEKVELHHRAHNTAWRRKKFPLFIDSILNMIPLHAHCHMENNGFEGITDYNVGRYEKFLERNPRWAKWVNLPREVVRVVW